MRTAKSTQRFLDFYFPDGGCDEGPSYFGVAGASLFDYLEEIFYATGGAVDLYGDPLIANIAKYIYRVHAGDDYYVNFADAPPRVRVATGLLKRVGAAIGDGALVKFSDFVEGAGFTRKPYEGDYGQIYRLISNIFHYKPSARAESYVAPRDHFFEGIQVMTARRRENGTDGIFVAFKGGHNAESHNHNDVGSYIIYRNGKPVVVDAGVETYTKFTFSDRRYDIWTMRSDYHNVPDINGYTQIPGAGARAADLEYGVTGGAAGDCVTGAAEVAAGGVKCRIVDDVTGSLAVGHDIDGAGGVTQMSLDIAGAYPKEAAVKSYKRSLRYDRSVDTVAVSDEYVLERAENPIVSHVMCYNEPKYGDSGELDLGGLTLAYDPEAFDVKIERIALTDPKISSDWKKGELYRILFTAKSTSHHGRHTFIFR